MQQICVLNSDRPNPISAEPNQTIFCQTIVRQTELCSAKTAKRVRQMRQISAEGSVFAQRVRGSVDH